MATLELEKSSARSSLEVQDSVSELAPTLTRPTPLDSAIPTPFPEQARNPTNTAAQAVQGAQTQTEGRKGRSPSIGRGIMDKVKRSFSRDRTVGDEASRSRSGERRQSVDANSTTTTEERGRSIFNPLRTVTTNNTTLTNGTRSTSRGRMVHATGRGGAGNMRITTDSPTQDEDRETIARAKEAAKSRSRSRGRELVHASGRGGAGNMRNESGSRGRLTEEELKAQKRKEEVDAELEREVIERREREGLEGLKAAGVKGISSGRGGAGNIKPLFGTGTAAASNPNPLNGHAA